MLPIVVLLGILSFLIGHTHFFTDPAFASCNEPTASIAFPERGQVIKDDFVTIRVEVPNQGSYDIQRVRILIKGHIDQTSGWHNLEKGWTFTGKDWYYYDDLESPYKATWYFHGLPYQEYTITFQIQVRGCQFYVYDHVTFSQNKEPPPPPPPIVAKFNVSTNSGYAPLAISFRDESTGTIDTYKWDFGDGASSSEKNPSHTYNVHGTYTVTLEVSNQSGGYATYVQTITVTQKPPVVDPPVVNPPPPLQPLKLNIPEKVNGIVGQEIPIYISVSQGSPSQISFTEWDSDGNGSLETNIPGYIPTSVSHQAYGPFKHRYSVRTTDNTNIEGMIEVGTFPDNMSYGLYITDLGNICGKLKPKDSASFQLPMSGPQNSASLTIWKAESSDDIYFWGMIDPDGRFQGSKNTPFVDIRPSKQGVWDITVSSGANVSDGRFWITVKVFEEGKIVKPVLWVSSEDPVFQAAIAGMDVARTASMAIGTMIGVCSVMPDPEACSRSNEKIEVWAPWQSIIRPLGNEMAGTTPTTLTATTGILGSAAIKALEIPKIIVDRILFLDVFTQYLIFSDAGSLEKAAEDYQRNYPYSNSSIVLAPKALPSVPDIVREAILAAASIKRKDIVITEEARKRAPTLTASLSSARVFKIENQFFDEYQEWVGRYGGNPGIANEWLFEQMITKIKTPLWASAEIAQDIKGGRSVKIYAPSRRDKTLDLSGATLDETFAKSRNYSSYTEIDRIFRITLKDGRIRYALGFVKSNIAKESEQLIQMQKIEGSIRLSSKLRNELGGEIPEIIGVIFDRAKGILLKAHKPVADDEPQSDEFRILFHAGSDIPFVDSLSLSLTEEGVKLRFHVSQEQDSSSYLVFKGNAMNGFRRRATLESSFEKKAFRYEYYIDREYPVSGVKYFIAVINRGMVVGLSDTVALELPTHVESANVDMTLKDESVPNLSAYPNPSNTEVTFKIIGLKDRDIEFTLYDTRGAVVRRWELPSSSENQRILLWDGKDEGNNTVSSGVYIVRTNFNNQSLTKKVVIIK